MKKHVIISAVFCILAVPGVIRADSPITSTNFYKAYLDIPEVVEAKNTGKMTETAMSFLASKKISIDKKAALINALGWSTRGKKNATIYFSMLMQKYGIKGKEDRKKYDLFSADELFCFGYLLIMDDYLHPDRAIGVLQKAHEKNKKSFTVAMILALAKAQKAMDSNWCRVWKLTESVLTDPGLRQDMRNRAKKIIVNYMVLYRDDCK